ncbi:hypothetical protein E8E13_002770 [Curvularia kusanoi]|uniref:RBR-type E3 ubiquitin transferase n=1 Tax=Curvularia kusanoi TaxID=90978 RepID=A0A9P4W4C0_CURKU|nr:hypothetical protein E8E13_002770 [Curvularia kusanoi]
MARRKQVPRTITGGPAPLGVAAHPNRRPPISTPTSGPSLAGKGATKPAKRRKRRDPWYPKRKANKTLKPRSSPSHYTCRICISYLPSESFVRWAPPIRYKGHPMDVPRHCIAHLARNPSLRNDPVCKTCVGAYMAAQLDTLGAHAVGQGCMEPKCENPWPVETILRYFPTSRLEEYNLAMFEHWRAKANLLECFEPRCGFVGLVENRTLGYPKLECPSPTCRARSCAFCRVPWHEGQSCAEISATRVTARISEEERKTLRLLQMQGAKRCPNCQFVVEKNGGCNSMVCVACRKCFDWDKAASAMGEKILPAAGSGFGFVMTDVACEVDELQKKAQQLPISQETLDFYRLEMSESTCSAPPLNVDDDL